MLAAVDVERWQEWAACKGTNPDVFYPLDDLGASHAKSFCANCPVQEACLRYALARREKHGIWGGKTTSERESIIRRARQRMLRSAL